MIVDPKTLIDPFDPAEVNALFEDIKGDYEPELFRYIFFYEYGGRDDLFKKRFGDKFYKYFNLKQKLLKEESKQERSVSTIAFHYLIANDFFLQ